MDVCKLSICLHDPVIYLFIWSLLYWLSPLHDWSMRCVHFGTDIELQSCISKEKWTGKKWIHYTNLFEAHVWESLCFKLLTCPVLTFFRLIWVWDSDCMWACYVRAMPEICWECIHLFNNTILDGKKHTVECVPPTSGSEYSLTFVLFLTGKPQHLD